MNNSYPIFNATKSFSISKIIGGISNILNVTNKAIPIYKEIKPLFRNGKDIIKIFKSTSKPNNIKKPVETSFNSIKSNNNPTFFIN